MRKKIFAANHSFIMYSIATAHYYSAWNDYFVMPCKTQGCISITYNHFLCICIAEAKTFLYSTDI
jgi:hypothetical protein